MTFSFYYLPAKIQYLYYEFYLAKDNCFTLSVPKKKPGDQLWFS
jgi:hypothetical protein